MLYIGIGNNLYPKEVQDLKEMKKVGSTDKLDIIRTMSDKPHNFSHGMIGQESITTDKGSVPTTFYWRRGDKQMNNDRHNELWQYRLVLLDLL